MSPPKAASATPFCFFLISVAYKLAWTTISSLLSDYSKEFGPEILLWLNFAYFIPSIPVLVIQSYFNDIVDKLCGAPQANLIRFTVGLGGLSLMCAVFPFISGTAASLLLSTCVVGVLYGVAFGTSYQMVARFPPENSVALTTGFVSSGLVVLLFDLLLKSGPYYTATGILWLYRLTAVQTVVGLIAAVWVILKHWQLLDVTSDSKSTDVSLDHRTGGAVGRSRPAPDTPNAASHLVFRHRATDEHQPGAMHPPVHNGSAAMSLHVDDDHDLAEGGRLDTTQPERASSKTGGVKPKVPLSAVFMRIWPAAAALFLSVGTSMLVFPFFTYMRSTGLLGDRLPQVLFYIRLIGDIAGRVCPRRMQTRTQGGLLWWSLVKTAMTPVLFICILRPAAAFGDVGAVLSIAIFWVLSGYINTLAYLLAPTLVAPSQSPRAGGLMATTFQLACVLALVLAYGIQRYLLGDATPQDPHMMHADDASRVMDAQGRAKWAQEEFLRHGPAVRLEPDNEDW